MEKPLVNFALIYTFAWCGVLLSNFFSSHKKPSSYLTIGFWAICIHAGYKLLWMILAGGNWYEVPIPFGLLYPVLLYLFAHSYYQPQERFLNRNKVFLLLPFLVYLGFFTVMLIWHSSPVLLIVYSQVYYGASMVSLFIYSVCTVMLYNKDNGNSTLTDILIRQLTMLCFGLLVFSSLTLYETINPQHDIGFEVRPMVFLFLAIGFALILRYRVDMRHNAEHKYKDAGTKGDQDKSHPTSRIPEALEQELVNVIDDVLHRSKLFLDPSVSLDMLAEQTGIPRHQLTQVLNVRYKKTFYQFIASARIRYAMDRMLEMGDSVTLDSLSYECGFNSKTSFNRYFKEYTDMTPSEYRSMFCQTMYAQ